MPIKFGINSEGKYFILRSYKRSVTEDQTTSKVLLPKNRRKELVRAFVPAETLFSHIYLSQWLQNCDRFLSKMQAFTFNSLFGILYFRSRSYNLIFGFSKYIFRGRSGTKMH
jgi:hypothetical protein